LTLEYARIVPNVKPIVLVIATSPSFSPARLAMALNKSGCGVVAVCLPRHPLRKTYAVRRVFPYNWLTPLRSIKNAIASASPDLLIPSDDLATVHLHELYVRENRRGHAGKAICALIEKSLGAPTSFSIVYGRSALMALAREEGIRVPKTAVITDPQDIERWAGSAGFPTVLKANGTSGGDGVRIVRSLEEAARAFRALQAPPLLARAVKRALLDQDMALLWPALLRQRYAVNAQAFVPGREATSAVACWKGGVLASLHFEVLQKQDAGGPSTVLRLIENAEMSAAAEKLVRRLKLSGLHGFDFMLEEHSGDPYLIEINPRATQVGHLPLGAGHDLPAALYAAVTGNLMHLGPRITDNDTVVLFPQEWLRDPTSPFIASGYHDVPWEEPEFVLFCVSRYQRQTAWYSPQKWALKWSRNHRRRS
jgi:carbamoylphosphate synthase large subunit